MENTPKDVPIPEIEETEEDKKLSDGDLKHKYVIFARKRFIRNPPVVVINKDINGNLFKINITVKKQKSLNRMFAYYYSATKIETKK